VSRSQESVFMIITLSKTLGPEVVEQALEILKVVSNATPDLNLDISTHLFGGCAIDTTGKPLPDDTLAACKAADAILMGTHRSLCVEMYPHHFLQRFRWWP
jgi:3-isopropylmalate dehydrogenase